MRRLLAATLVLNCLAITPGWFWYFDITPKVLTLLFGAAAAAFLFVRSRTNPLWIRASRAGNIYTSLLAIQLLFLTVATVSSLHPALSVFGSNWRRLGLLSLTALSAFSLFTASALVSDGTLQKTILRAVVWSGGIASIYGILQYFGFDPLLPAGSYLAGEAEFTIVRPPGTLGHADYFGCYLLFVVGYAVALSSLELRWLRRLAIAIAILASAAMVLTGTRAALLGLLAGTGVLLPFYVRLVRPKHVAVLVMALLASGLFVASPLGTKLRARVRWSMDDWLGGARPMLWKDTWGMISTRPWQGYGPDTFPAEFPKHQSLELARAYPDFYHESPHNMFLDAAAGAGLPSLLMLLALTGYGLWLAWGLRLDEPALALSLGASLLAIVIAQQFIVFTTPTALLFYVTLALLVGASIKPVPVIPNSRMSMVSAAVMVVLALSFTAAGVTLAVSDATLSLAAKAVGQKDIEKATRLYRLAHAWQLPAGNSDLLYSRVLAAASTDQALSIPQRAASRKEALELAARAPAESENPQNAYFSLAMLLAAQDDAAGAEKSLREAIAVAPVWYKPHWALALLLEHTNRRDEARKEASAAIERAGKNAEVKATLAHLQ